MFKNYKYIVYILGIFIVIFALPHQSFAATTWTTESTAAVGTATDNGWQNVLWAASAPNGSGGTGLFVAISGASTGYRVMTSPDGITWTIRRSAADNIWTGLAWSPSLSLFVATSQSGTGNRVMTSPDGVNWTSRTSPADNNWSSVVWSSSLSLFVSVSNTGTGNRVMTSPDGISWTTRTSAADNAWQSVAWSPTLSLFVATSTSGTGNRVMTSPDGITWTTRTSAADNAWNTVAWSPTANTTGMFVAVGTTAGIGNHIMTSPDGITWTTRTAAADVNLRSVIWSPSLSIFVAVGITGTGNRVMTSPDGITWTSRSSAADNNWLAVTWSPSLSLFVTIANTGTGRVMTSPDGINWTIRSAIYNTDNAWTGVAWSPSLGLFAAVSNTGTGNRVMTSPDGGTWTARTSASDNNWTSIAWSPTANTTGLFAAVASSGTNTRIMTSPDGITWTTRTNPTNDSFNSIIWSPDLSLFVAVGLSGGGVGVMTSPDGITWTGRSNPVNATWNSVAWSPSLSLLVAVASTGTGNRVMTSPNGTTWTMRTSAADNNWTSVAWSPTLALFVAVANSGTGNRVMTSPDGINWTTRTSAADNNWTSVVWSPDLAEFRAVATSGTGNRVMVSTDGTTWTTQTSAVNNPWTSVTWAPSLGIYAAVASTSVNDGVMVSGPAFPNSVSLTPAATSAAVMWTTDVASTTQVFYGSTSSYGSSTTLDSTNVTSHSASITGLTCGGTTYHYKVTSTENGITSSSPDATFVTTICLSTPTVTTSVATSLTQTSATLNGTITSDAGLTITARGFHYGTTSSYGSTTVESGSFSTGTFSAAISSLTCNTTYHYQAYATNSSDTGVSTPDTTFTTSPCLPGIPDPVYGLSANNQIKVFWGIPANGGAAISDYILEYKPTAGSTWTTFAHTPSSNAYAMVTGLTNGASYDFRVAAVNSAGTGTTSSAKTIVDGSSIYLHILSTGQSLSTGTNANPSLSTTQPYHNLSLSPRIYSDVTPTIPLIPLIEPADDNETPSSGMANSLSVQDPLGRSIVVGDHGQPGWFYSQIKKGGGAHAYARGMIQATLTKSEVEAAGGTYVPIAVTIVHGEADATAGADAALYEGYMEQMQNDYQTDLNALTGGTGIIPFFQSQMNTNSKGDVAVGQLNAYRNTPGKIYLIGPKYQYAYNSSDHIHLTATSSKYMGEMFAKAMKKVLFDGQSWDPLVPVAVQRLSNVVTVSYKIPVGSLAIDTTTLAQRPNYGFEFTQTGGSAISISSVALVNNNTQVQITLSGAPDGTNPHIRYAWTCYATPNNFLFANCGDPTNSNFVGGNIRDTDSSVSPEAGSTGLPLYDFGVTFDEPITAAIAPSAPTSLAGNASSGQVALTWNAPLNGGAAITDYVVEYKLSSDSSWTTFADGVSASTGATVTGLTNGISYDFRVSATNSIGTGATSATTTVVGAIPTTTSSAASSITLNTATLNGTITSIGTASATVRGFNYGLTTGYGTTTTESGTFSTGTFTSALVGLSCNTTYHFRAYATNNAGTGVSADNTFTTSPCAPTVTTGSSSSIGLTSATLAGTITVTGGASVTTRGISYGTTTAYGTDVPEVGTFGTGAFTESITGLDCGTTYHYQAYAINISGTSSGSDATFTTTACPVTVPVLGAPSASAIDKLVATLNGIVTSIGHAAVTARGFYWGLTSSYGQALTETGSFPAESFSAVLSGLACGVGYHFQAYATNIAGTGTSSGDSQFSTLSCIENSGTRGHVIAATKTNSLPPQAAAGHSFKKPLKAGAVDPDVKLLQQFLNTHGFRITASGPGAPGQETTLFGAKTVQALKRFQEANAKYVLTPSGLKKGTGYFGPATITFVNTML